MRERAGRASDSELAYTEADPLTAYVHWFRWELPIDKGNPNPLTAVFKLNELRICTVDGANKPVDALG